MSSQLQVQFEDEEFRRIHAAAERDGLAVPDWARRVLLEAAGFARRASAEEKLAAVRAALEYRAPAPDIDIMLAEIEQGYLPQSE